MIVGFVGTIDDESNTPISGNGKTCSMTGYGFLDYLNNKHVWSNYETTFSEEVIGMQAMIEKIGGEERPDTILLISEMQQVLNSIGSTQNQVLFIDSFASQLRKLDVDLYYDTQRFNNIHKRLRIHTDVILVPEKRHFDNARCNFNRCMKPHKIYIYSYKPWIDKPVRCFNAVEAGKLYNTKEIIMDKLLIPNNKRGE